MPINSANNNNQLIEEISKLNLSGTGFRYIKNINCNISANIKTKILNSTDNCLREVLLINRTQDAIIELFWNDGTNETKTPNKLDNNNTHYIDYSDGGMELLVKSNIDINLDIYVRSTKPINYQVGNIPSIIEIPVIEDIWYTTKESYYPLLVPFKIPLKPVFIFISNWETEQIVYDEEGNEIGTEPALVFPVIELPHTDESGYQFNNKKQIGDTSDMFQWLGFEVLKEYNFYIEYTPYESTSLYINEITQNSERWLIDLNW